MLWDQHHECQYIGNAQECESGTHGKCQDAHKNFMLKRESTNKQKGDTERCSKSNGVAN